MPSPITADLLPGLRQRSPYDLATDWWDGHVAKEVGAGFGRLIQSYGVHKTIREAGSGDHPGARQHLGRGPPPVIVFGPRYLAEALAIGPVLRLIDGISPGVTTTTGPSGSYCVIMPCRLVEIAEESNAQTRHSGPGHGGVNAGLPIGNVSHMPPAISFGIGGRFGRG